MIPRIKKARGIRQTRGSDKWRRRIYNKSVGDLFKLTDKRPELEVIVENVRTDDNQQRTTGLRVGIRIKATNEGIR